MLFIVAKKKGGKIIKIVYDWKDKNHWSTNGYYQLIVRILKKNTNFLGKVF